MVRSNSLDTGVTVLWLIYIDVAEHVHIAQTQTSIATPISVMGRNPSPSRYPRAM